MDENASLIRCKYYNGKDGKFSSWQPVPETMAKRIFSKHTEEKGHQRNIVLANEKRTYDATFKKKDVQTIRAKVLSKLQPSSGQPMDMPRKTAICKWKGLSRLISQVTATKT